MKPLLERIASGETLVGDGALGTMLFQKGLKPGEAPETINLTRPEILQDIAGQYLAAGAEHIVTNTFGASPMKLRLHGLGDDAERINRSAVAAVRAAVGDRAYVSASCGPSGRMLKPYGDTDPADIYESYHRQMEWLTDSGVDCICIETMSDLTEAQLAVRAARDVSASMPVIATMTFDVTPRGFYTMMGVTAERAVLGLREASADVVGSNCGNGIERMVEIAREFRRRTDSPLIFQANAGLPSIESGLAVYPESPDFTADRARALLSLGVSIIGGCCGTTPEHIRAIREMVDSLRGPGQNSDEATDQNRDC